MTITLGNGNAAVVRQSGGEVAGVNDAGENGGNGVHDAGVKGVAVNDGEGLNEQGTTSKKRASTSTGNTTTTTTSAAFLDYGACGAKRVKCIDFGILSPTEIKQLGVAEITSTVLYNKNAPKDNSLNDLRMGTSDPKLRCKRCKNDIITCPGHCGYITLPVPVYHVAYVATLVKILRAVCPWCLLLLVRDDDPYLQRFHGLCDDQLFAQLTGHLKTKRRCPHCWRSVPKYTQHALHITRDWSTHTPADSPELQAPLTPAIVRSIMQKIPNRVLEQLGLHPESSHPASAIIDVLLVPPPIIRPSIVFGSTARLRGQDDLTQRLQDILKTIERLQKNELRTDIVPNPGKEDKGKMRERLIAHLQGQVATYMNNDCSTGKAHVKRRSGRPMKSISKRLKGKKGRARANLNGKRVNYCARGPITPDPNIRVDEVGVPIQIALNLTYPDIANIYNLQQLQTIVDTGANTLGGAHCVVAKKDGRTILLQHLREPYRVQLGDRVHRYLRNGPPVCLVSCVCMCVCV